MNISFPVRGLPKGQPRPKVGGKHGYNPKVADGWKALVILAARKAMVGVAMAKGPVKLVVCYNLLVPKNRLNSKGEFKSMLDTYATCKPDLDNLDKLIMDALTEAKVWKDDAQVVIKITSKNLNSVPGAFISVKCI